ncbi:MAG: YihY/virulence factor BrkB family protein [Sporolactobacillus sp.]|jgi:membrane protein|nr:YihY/virulence factor BrkB family protein [Sporolactobacillus sp.]MCI1881933.1 YihY/virulence factor BrkB family protein [Sporolactobacillus sp.]
MIKKEEFREAGRWLALLGRRLIDDHTVDLAATLAYYLLLSLFPLVIFLFAVIPYVGLTQAQVMPFLSRYLPSEATDLIRQNIGSVFTKNSGLLSVGVIATLWPVSNAVNALMRTLNRAYRVKETRPFFITRLLAMCFTVAMIFTVAMALAINVISAAWARALFRYLGLSDTFADAWSLLSTLTTFALMIVIFVLLYMLGPNIRLRPRDVAVGAVMAGAGWQIASYAFSFYVRYFGHYVTTYGTLGGIIVLMLWFYLTALTIIVGGEINALRFQLKKKGPRRL